ncbi:hypothetical protein, partial [Escherichia coli]|uniref:hypothetical protein n=1 Tax=Escherichia coli TaxID=562 RepID=UPI0030C6640A
MKKQPLLWMTIAAALLSGCTGHREHHPQVTFTVDTVRTDTTASNPICLAEKYGSLLNERHPDLFAGAQGSISRSAFFNDSLTLTPETLHGMIQNTPCVESLVPSVGPDTYIHGAPGNITLRLSTTDQKRKQTVE